MRSLRRLVSPSTFLVAASALNVLFLQMAPLLLLEPLNFGYYSIIQLMVILGSSVSLALINEADVRRINSGFQVSSWRDFSAITFWLSLVFFLLTLSVSLIYDQLRENAILWAFGVGFAVYRGAARYRLTQEKLITRLVIGDISGIILIITTISWLYHLNSGLWTLTDILVLWLAAQLIGTMFTKFPSSINPFRVARWLRDRKRQIFALMPDSFLQDMGSFWGPYMIALILDVQSLGIYRAVTTVAAPIRLILTPLRPIFAKHASGTKFSLGTLGVVSGISIVSGVLAALALHVLSFEGDAFGVLGELSVFVTPVGVYVAGNFLSYFYSIKGRAVLPALILIRTRIVQAILLGLLPLLGASLCGLEGAVWALSCGSIGVGFIWCLTLWNYSKSASDEVRENENG